MDTSSDEHVNEWEECLSEESKMEKRQPFEESHETVVTSDAGRGDFLHKVTKRALWMGCTQILEEAYDVAVPPKRVQEHRQENSDHWKVSHEAQKLDDKPRKHI